MDLIETNSWSIKSTKNLSLNLKSKGKKDEDERMHHGTFDNH